MRWVAAATLVSLTGSGLLACQAGLAAAARVSISELSSVALPVAAAISSELPSAIVVATQEPAAARAAGQNVTHNSSASDAARPCGVAGGPWIPGFEDQDQICCGLWTDCWRDKNGALPAELVAKLEYTPALLQRVRDGDCPYGRALPGQITWPGLPAGTPSELSEVVGKLTTLKVIAVIYSYLPYGVGLCVIFSFLVHRGTQQLWVLLWLCLQLCLSEFVFKYIWHEPRPGMLMQVRDESGRYVGSCLSTCGMPSSHSALAMGWFVLLFLDAVFRVNPYAGLGSYSISMHASDERATNLSMRDTGAFCRREVQNAWKMTRFIVLVPWVHSDSLTHLKFVAYMIVWFLIMIPVPFMRVALYDHTTGQVAAGAFMGPVVAILWWRFVRYLQQRFRHWENHRFFFGLLVHNYTLPRLQSVPRYRWQGTSTVSQQSISFTTTPPLPVVETDIVVETEERLSGNSKPEEPGSSIDVAPCSHA